MPVGRARQQSSIDLKADFDRHLPMVHLSFVDTSTRFHQLEPRQFLEGLVRALKGLIYGVLDGSGRCPSEFDEFIDWFFHVLFVRLSRCETKSLWALFSNGA